MWRRKRSRPSSKRRLTKKVKRLSSGSSVCASAIGVVDEHKLRTNGHVSAAGTADSSASASVDARFAVDVITSPDSPTATGNRTRLEHAEGNALDHTRARSAAPPS